MKYHQLGCCRFHRYLVKVEDETGGFYAWLTLPRSRRSLSDEALSAQVRQSFLRSDRTYCPRRVWHDVLEQGQACGLHRIEMLMREQTLRARPRRRGLPKDRSARGAVVGNVLDLFSRQIVGWWMGERMTRELAIGALLMAVWRRKPVQEVLVHPDQGSQFSSHDWQDFLKAHRLKPCMSRRGNCHDNAVVESFFQLLRLERIMRRIYLTRDEARADVFDYIDLFYNPKRRHSNNDQLSPIEYERRYLLRNGTV